MGINISINKQINKAIKKEEEKLQKKFNNILKKIEIFSNEKYMTNFVKKITKSFYKNYIQSNIINKIVNKILESDSQEIEINDFIINIISNNNINMYKFKLSFCEKQKYYYYRNSYDQRWEKLFDNQITVEIIRVKDIALKFMSDKIKKNLFELISNDFDVKRVNKKIIIKLKDNTKVNKNNKINKITPIDEPPPYKFKDLQQNLLFTPPAYQEYI